MLFNFKDWIFHSAVIYRPELCKRDGMMKTRLSTNIDGYPFRLVLLFEAYSDGADLIKVIEVPVNNLVWVLAYFFVSLATVVLRAKIVYLQLLIKHD